MAYQSSTGKDFLTYATYVICYVSLRSAFQAVTVVMSRPIEQAVKMEGVLSIRRISIRRIPIIGLGIGLGLGLGIGFGELKFGELKRNQMELGSWRGEGVSVQVVSVSGHGQWLVDSAG